MENPREFERAYNKEYSSKSVPQFNNNFQPELIRLQNEKGEIIKDNLVRWNLLKETYKVQDIFEKLLLELFLIHHPELKPKPECVKEEFAKYKAHYIKFDNEWAAGVWAAYPNKTLIHLLEDKDYYIVKTSRNLGLLTEDNLSRLKNLRVAVAGLSVGSITAHCLAMEGVRQFYFADFDELSGSNLNRLPASLAEIGLAKTAIIGRKIWDLDPFAEITCDNRGLCEESIHSFFGGDNPVDVVIDAMDTIEGKILLRKEAKKRKIPVVWMLHMGDGVVQIGVERYDRNPDYPLFHGRLERMQKKFNRELNYFESFLSIVNYEHLSSKVAYSFLGTCEYSFPGVSQLASTIFIAAGTVAKVVRMIAFGDNVNNEFFVTVDSVANKNFQQDNQKDREATYKLMASLGIKNE
ncbi:hypothetical protein NUACC21_45730 [Scytonema sp. NUACC21]